MVLYELCGSVKIHIGKDCHLLVIQYHYCVTWFHYLNGAYFPPNVSTDFHHIMSHQLFDSASKPSSTSGFLLETWNGLFQGNSGKAQSDFMTLSQCFMPMQTLILAWNDGSWNLWSSPNVNASPRQKLQIKATIKANTEHGSPNTQTKYAKVMFFCDCLSC